MGFRYGGACAKDSGPPFIRLRHGHVTRGLVRDKIPDLIEGMGDVPIGRELDDASFRKALLDTIVTAAHQFAQTESLEALADVLDAVDRWLAQSGLRPEDVQQVRADRRKRCGDFARRYYLENVTPGADICRLTPRNHC